MSEGHCMPGPGGDSPEGPAAHFQPVLQPAVKMDAAYSSAQSEQWFISFKLVYFHLLARQRERKREGEGRIFHLLIPSPDAHNSQGWARCALARG